MSGSDVRPQTDEPQDNPDDQKPGWAKRLKKWLATWRPSKATAEEIAAKNRRWWFEEYLPSVQGHWEERIKNYQCIYPTATRAEAQKESCGPVLEQAKTEYNKLDRDLDKGLQRSNVITGSAAMVAALVLGIVTLVATQKIAFSVPIFLCAASLMTVSFLLNMWSMRPQLRRAISEPFVDMAGWSVLVVDTFTEWAMLTYSCRTRQKIVTKYKLLHSVSITVFVVGVVLLGPAFLWPQIVRAASSLF